MALPRPEPGLVISFEYLWRYERDAGRESGRKARPCVVVLAVRKSRAGVTVAVAPITHLLPATGRPALELPAGVKAALGLDEQPSWIIADDINTFTWPGVDLRTLPGQPGEFVYGRLPPGLLNRLVETVRAAWRDRRGRTTVRDA